MAPKTMSIDSFAPCNTLITFFGLLFLLFFLNPIMASPVELLEETLKEEDACGKVNCGQGKCVVSNTSLLGFDCICNPGWNQMQVGPVKFPACSVPNCTVNYECGNGPPPPPPPPPTNPPPFDLFNPCNLVWCGDGTCVANGLTYSCQCNDGSANFLNLTGVACMKQCYFGSDCTGVTLGHPPPPPAGNAFGSPPPPVNGSSSRPNCSPSFRQVTASVILTLILVLASTF